MALKIIYEKIVGTIDNLQEKLNGEIPIDRLELLVLVNSWGRTKSFYIFDLNQDIDIEECEATQSEQAFYQNATSNPLLVKKLVRKECYDLSKLDTSEITDMSSIFRNSEFNGDISTWDISA